MNTLISRKNYIQQLEKLKNEHINFKFQTKIYFPFFR
jgi:hypothetical protein